MKLISRIALILSAALCVFAPAQAQEFPTRPIRIIVPYGPAGGPDAVSRLIAAPMSVALGQQVVVENRGGGGGIPAIQEFLNAPADGYTVFNPDSSQWAILPALQTVPYDAARDFVPVGLIFTGAQHYVVPASLPVANLKELIALAKSKPGTLNFGSPGIGGLQHLQGETFKAALGLDIKHIPYKGGAELVEALLRNDIHLTFLSPASIDPHVKAGKLKVLAVGTKTRTKLAPNVPTVAELTGVSDFDFAGQMGMVVRPGTPKPVIDKLSAALNKALTHPEVVAKIEALGIEATPSKPEQFGELMRNDMVKFANAVKLSGMKKQ